ncbi:MAG TPA: M20 family metallopeptidase [Thermoplasmata archaeon]|nr:M20 family metallopeptidase [Thermoplasmata archaeon]
MAPVAGRWTRSTRRVLPQMRAWRIAFHEDPELSDQETHTRDRVVSALRALSLDPITYGDGFNGVLAMIVGDRPGSVVALRADMDALPVSEETGLAFRSRNPGRMHACGHDVHMSALLGAAAVLARHRSELRGAVKLLFQPAEEEGEKGGALPFLERGCFERPKVDYVVGQHVDPAVPLGSIGTRVGPAMAAADRFRIRIRGHGGHAAAPHLGPDAVLVASEIVVGLQALVSRVRSPVDPVVVSVGQIHGGTRHNILPDEVVLDGTVRTFRPATRERMEVALRRRVRSIAASLEAKVRIEYYRGYPALWNPAGPTRVITGALRSEFGVGRVIELEEPVMGAEDFARYLERVPGTFFQLGVGVAGRSAGLHSAQFAPPEAALVYGAAALLAATEALQRNPP